MGLQTKLQAAPVNAYCLLFTSVEAVLPGIHSQAALKTGGSIADFLGGGRQLFCPRADKTLCAGKRPARCDRGGSHLLEEGRGPESNSHKSQKCHLLAAHSGREERACSTVAKGIKLPFSGPS